jgi:integrase/recombinase XerD
VLLLFSTDKLVLNACRCASGGSRLPQAALSRGSGAEKQEAPSEACARCGRVLQGRPGVPILLDDRMNLVEPACAWFLDLARRGRTQSECTWRSYADAIYDWFLTLEANGLAWDAVGEGHLMSYRDALKGSLSSATRRPLKTSTINGRLRRVALFYRWAAARGYIAQTPFSYEQIELPVRTSSGRLAHTARPRGSAEVNALTLRESPEGLPRCLLLSELLAIQRHLGPRDRLIVQWAVATGMRRAEVLGLADGQIPMTKSVRDSGFRPQVYFQGKGAKWRFCYPPLVLVDRTNDYVLEERASIVKAAKRKNRTYEAPRALWLSASGAPLSASALAKNYRLACEAAGVKARFHDLRHTFAIRILAELERKKAADPTLDLNPLLILKRLLGHSNLSTTEVYLESLKIDAARVWESVDVLFEEFDGETTHA